MRVSGSPNLQGCEGYAQFNYGLQVRLSGAKRYRTLPYIGGGIGGGIGGDFHGFNGLNDVDGTALASTKFDARYFRTGSRFRGVVTAWYGPNVGLVHVNHRKLVQTTATVYLGTVPAARKKKR